MGCWDQIGRFLQINYEKHRDRANFSNSFSQISEERVISPHIFLSIFDGGIFSARFNVAFNFQKWLTVTFLTASVATYAFS